MSDSPEIPPPTRATDPDDVHLYTSPWVGGTRAESYHGPISSTIHFIDTTSFEAALTLALDEIQQKCASLGGNSIVGVELCIDPFATSPYVQIVGTSAKLVPLFS